MFPPSQRKKADAPCTVKCRSHQPKIGSFSFRYGRTSFPGKNRDRLPTVPGPSDWIRTSGLLNPIQARYQTSPHPDIHLLFSDSSNILAQISGNVNPYFSFFACGVSFPAGVRLPEAPDPIQQGFPVDIFRDLPAHTVRQWAVGGQLPEDCTLKLRNRHFLVGLCGRH